MTGKATEGVVDGPPVITTSVQFLATKAASQEIRRVVKTSPVFQLVFTQYQ